ncbi:DegT/DnrJ/EryC1/StrS family aminotransferase [Qipengyuania sediminis]|uniref:DegT/DnrJ/EryC1/StrS family aminotransferase n=1 Tax=Qipengyuania sediminis TaxID=1532023 RepID=UPI0023EA5869|nr:DegT/DnrJ/EryC1/StrS family aminotransferase [Qipengyuania sediminis]
MTIPFIDLAAQFAAIEPDVRTRMDRVLAHGQFIMGPEVAEMEAALAEFVGEGRECISCASGTEALLIALMALGIGPGDEVITTPFTFVATGEMIALLGATPVFVDVRLEDANIDERLIEAAITARTKAIIPVSLYGQPSDMVAIERIADAHGLTVIEDAAQSFGAEQGGVRSCGLSRLATTSFFPSKPLGCYGDGGAIFTSDPELAQAMREIRVHGQSKRYVHTRIGVGGRMDTLQCAVVLAKMTRFGEELDLRAEVAQRYCDGLSGLDPALRLIEVATDRTSVWAQYTVRVTDRDGLAAALQAEGIPTAVHYPVPLNDQPAYRDLARGGATPNARVLAGTVMSLPMSADLSMQDQMRIIATIKRTLQS